MDPGFDLPGKIRLFVKKRPLEVLFLFASLAAAAAAVSSYKTNASPISLKIEGRGEILRLVQVYSVPYNRTLEELERRDGAWVGEKGKYSWRLLIALPKGGLAGVSRVRVGVGKREFEFNAADFHEFGLLKLGAVDNKEWDVYHLPGLVRNERSLYPNFEPINWRGDASFLLGAVLRFSLYSVCLALLFALFDPSILTRVGAGGKAPGETAPPAGSFRAGKWGRALNLGRPFHLGLVFLITFGVTGALSVLRVDPHHDGVMLKPACDVAAGQAVFRDTFTQYGALTTWTQALAVKIAGKHVLTIRLLTALTYGLIAVLMWLLYSRFLPNYLNTFSCLSWLFLGYFFLNYPGMYILPWSTLFAVCSALFSLLLILRFLETGSRSVLFASGAVAALTFWFKINYGAASFLATLLFLAVLQLREERGRAAGTYAAFLGGCFAAHALFAGWLAAQGSLHDFWLQSVRFALAFSGNTVFSSHEYPAVRVIKSLLQVNSPHGGISYLWLALPLASCAVFLSSARAFAIKKDVSAPNKALLAVSSASLGLWLGYYPVPALFHMYLSSVLFFGPLAYLVLRAADKLGFAGSRLLVLAALTLVFLPDFGYRLRSLMVKLSAASSLERIETPKFLRGMYVPREEKKAFAELERLISGAPGPLINLTNSGLFSLYKDGGPGFHKMYMDWGWINSFLYPDYIPAVARQLRAGKGCVLSGDSYMIPGYIPVKVFPAFAAGEVSNNPIVLLLPGRRVKKLAFSGADTLSRPGAEDGYTRGYRFRMKAGRAPAVLDSVVVKIISGNTVQVRIPRYEYEYELLPKIFDPAAKELIKKSYMFDAGRNEYGLAVPLDGRAGLLLMDALSGVFLYEKNSYLADTFQDSKKPRISVYRNGKAVSHGDFFDGSGYKAGDSLDILVPAAFIAESYAARLRFNFKDGEYQEEKILVYKR